MTTVAPRRKRDALYAVKFYDPEFPPATMVFVLKGDPDQELIRRWIAIQDDDVLAFLAEMQMTIIARWRSHKRFFRWLSKARQPLHWNFLNIEIDPSIMSLPIPSAPAEATPPWRPLAFE